MLYRPTIKISAAQSRESGHVVISLLLLLLLLMLQQASVCAVGGYEPRNRDYRIDTYSTEDWDGEKQFVSKKDSSSSRAKQDGDAVVSKPPVERRSR